MTGDTNADKAIRHSIATNIIVTILIITQTLNGGCALAKERLNNAGT